MKSSCVDLLKLSYFLTHTHTPWSSREKGRQPLASVSQREQFRASFFFEEALSGRYTKADWANFLLLVATVMGSK